MILNHMEEKLDPTNSRSIFKSDLLFSEKILVKRSDIHRWGVFAKNEIKKYEVIEEFPYFSVTSTEMDKTTSIVDYSYRFNDGYIIGMGCCGLYNHSFTPNLAYCVDDANEIMIHYAIRDIYPGEELTLNYGEENVKHFVDQN